MAEKPHNDSFTKPVLIGAVSTVLGGIALFHMGYGGNPLPTDPSTASVIPRAEITMPSNPVIEKPSIIPAGPKERLPAATEVYEKKFPWIVIRARGDAIPWAKIIEAELLDNWQSWNLDLLATTKNEPDKHCEELFATSEGAIVIYSWTLGSHNYNGHRPLMATADFASFVSTLSVTFAKTFPIREVEKTMAGARMVARGDAIPYALQIWDMLEKSKGLLHSKSNGLTPPGKSRYSFSSEPSGMAVILPHTSVEASGQESLANSSLIIESEIGRLARGEARQ